MRQPQKLSRRAEWRLDAASSACVHGLESFGEPLIKFHSIASIPSGAIALTHFASFTARDPEGTPPRPFEASTSSENLLGSEETPLAGAGHWLAGSSPAFASVLPWPLQFSFGMSPQEASWQGCIPVVLSPAAKGWRDALNVCIIAGTALGADFASLRPVVSFFVWHGSHDRVWDEYSSIFTNSRTNEKEQMGQTVSHLTIVFAGQSLLGTPKECLAAT
jgi:hypothetical protein